VYLSEQLLKEDFFSLVSFQHSYVTKLMIPKLEDEERKFYQWMEAEFPMDPSLPWA
jgi:hypothetical protein